jgi:methyl-branched lipid omega-hydroxylase
MGLKTGSKNGLATRVNGVPPPEIPLADINLSSLEFWGLDDDIRDAAFATLRREAPVSYWPAIEYEGFSLLPPIDPVLVGGVFDLDSGWWRV